MCLPCTGQELADFKLFGSFGRIFCFRFTATRKTGRPYHYLVAAEISTRKTVGQVSGGNGDCFFKSHDGGFLLFCETKKRTLTWHFLSLANNSLGKIRLGRTEEDVRYYCFGNYFYQVSRNSKYCGLRVALTGPKRKPEYSCVGASRTSPHGWGLTLGRKGKVFLTEAWYDKDVCCRVSRVLFREKRHQNLRREVTMSRSHHVQHRCVIREEVAHVSVWRYT